MKPSYNSPQFLATITAIEPAARIVPARALRRCIRLSRGGDDVGASTPHDLCWRVSRENLAKYITLGELGIDPKDQAGEFVLIPEPTGTDTGVAAQVIRRAIFHALSDLGRTFFRV